MLLRCVVDKLIVQLCTGFNWYALYPGSKYLQWNLVVPSRKLGGPCVALNMAAVRCAEVLISATASGYRFESRPLQWLF